MRTFFRNLQSWWWDRLHPEFDEPDEDTVTPAAMRQWVAGLKHPAECASGCVCDFGNLTNLLTHLREQVAKGWSKDTADPLWDGRPGSPVGQCGVTSAWLQEQLRARGIESTYMEGQVYLGESEGCHCWLDVNGVVVDLTASQFGLPDVVYGAPEGAVYEGRPGVQPLDRLALLKAALNWEGGG